MEHTKVLNAAKTVVIKIGSSTIIGGNTGKINEIWMSNLANQINDMKKNGQNVVIVSSGAVGLGKGLLKVPLKGDTALETKQAAAAAGNPELATAYKNVFSPFNIPVGLVLLTPRDTEQPRRRYNIRLTINELLARGAVPIINENDTTTTYELRYGDNDQLASFVCGAIGGDLVILLTDVDGLFSANPMTNKDAKFFDVVRQVTPSIMALGGGAGSAVGTGGMATKLLSAKYATEKAGANLIIANSGSGNGDPLGALRTGQTRATLFTSQQTPTRAYNMALAKDANENNALLVISRERACELVTNSGDILPADILFAKGNKDRGEAVRLFTPNANRDDFERMGFVVIEQSINEINKIKGLKTNEDIAKGLGYKGRYAVVKQQNFHLRNEFIVTVLKQEKEQKTKIDNISKL